MFNRNGIPSRSRNRGKLRLALAAVVALFASIAASNAAAPPSQANYTCNLSPTCQVQAVLSGWWNSALGYFVPTGNDNPLPVGLSAGSVVITQTIVTLTAATSRALIAANTSRKYLCWMNVGTAPFTVAPGAVTVTAGQGFNYDPGSSASNQGGAFCQENSSVSQQAFSAISTAGTTVAVWEGQ